MSQETMTLWERVRENAGGYPPQAFAFVHQGLQHTAEALSAMREEVAAGTTGAGEGGGGERHISGQELCLGLRDFALRQFGLMARTVLESWNIRGTEDFGRIVFILVEAKVLRKSDSDSFEDFSAVYDFDEAFTTDPGRSR